jgi:hypothetical protein
MELKSTIKKIKSHKYFNIIFAIVVLGIAVRIAMPPVIKHYLNNYLAKMESYTGHIGDFDLSLWRGAYQIEEFTLKRKTAKGDIPFVDVPKADINVAWKALFRGKFQVDLDIKNPKVNFTDSKKKSEKQLGVEAKKETWQDLLDKLVPFNLESLKISSGEIHFKNPEIKPGIDIFLNEINFTAHNIHNSKKQDGALFSSYDLTAKAQNHANIKSNGKFNILKEPIDFDMNLALEALDLRQLNPFLKSYIPLDLTSGTFNFYMELAAKDSAIKGYLKPMFKNMDVRAGEREEDGSLKEFGFEILSAVVNGILHNFKNKTLATKIPIEGSLKDPKLGLWEAFKIAVKNGFGEPDVAPKVDNEISLKDAEKEKKENAKASKK